MELVQAIAVRMKILNVQPMVIVVKIEYFSLKLLKNLYLLIKSQVTHIPKIHLQKIRPRVVMMKMLNVTLMAIRKN